MQNQGLLPISRQMQQSRDLDTTILKLRIGALLDFTRNNKFSSFV